MRWLLAMVSILLCVTPAAAQETRSLAPGAAPPPAQVDQLAWLEGSWAGEGFGGSASETYSAVQGEQLTGHFVQQDGEGGIAFTELVQIVPHGPDGRSLAYRVRHFNPDMSGWEDESGKPVVFPLIAVEGDRWYFNGLTIHREAPDRMTIWVRIGDGEAAKEVPFRYRRVR